VIKILLRAALLLTAVFLTAAILFFSPIPYDNIFASTINKTTLLKSKKTTPRIIFIGGSGLLVGIDSPTIEKELNLSPVNMGLGQAFGLIFYLKQLEKEAQRGDVIVMIPEYAMLFGSFATASLYRKWCVATSSCLAFNSLYSMPRELSKFIFDVLGICQWKALTLTRAFLHKDLSSLHREGYIQYEKHFNKFGDFINDGFGVLPKGKKHYYGEIYPHNLLSSSELSILYNFADTMSKHGIKTFLSFQAFPDEEYNLNKHQIDSVYNQLKDNHHFDVLGTPEDFLFKYDLFSDSKNHLLMCGRKIRTEKIILMIKQKSSNNLN
jgi:hypothetical protein